MRCTRRVAAALVILFMVYPSIAAETVTYSYDAKGRLVKVVRVGAVNNGVTTDIAHDKADNRTRVKVAGASR